MGSAPTWRSAPGTRPPVGSGRAEQSAYRVSWARI